MNNRLTPPDWDAFDSNMLINVGDMKYYYENFTEVVDEQASTNKLAIDTIDGRVTALEHSIPVGPGGDGAYLHLGGTPERYPTAEEMVAGSDNSETSFMVIARPDGIYFYNPKTKIVIPPKKGGGTIAVHGQFPQIFDTGHSHTHTGRAGLSGIYTAKVADVGLDVHFTNFDTVTMLVVVNENGEEYQTAYSPDGMASRIFRTGVQTAHWGVNSGGGGGGGSVDPIIIQEIKDRLDALEAHGHIENIVDLKDVVLDNVTDVNGLLYMDATGKIRGGPTNPMLGMGYTHVHTNAVGTPPVVVSGNVTSTVAASNNIILFRGTLTKQVNLPNVVAYNTYQPSTSQVREGRTTFIVNTSSVPLTVKVPTGGMFYVEGGMDSTNAVIPAKTTYIYNPAILDNGSGAMIECWVYMGNYPLRASDLTGIMTEIQELKDKNTSQDVEILKTQADLATTDVAVASTNDRIDAHLIDFNKMSTGNYLTSWNGLGADPASTSGDITATTMSSTPFCVGQGTSTGKKFIMAEIADKTVSNLTATQVREGRFTFLINIGSNSRSVELTGGCKFNMTGSNVTTKQTIPAKTVWMMVPGIYTNGDKVWTFSGSFSAEALDFKTLVNRVAALEAGGGPGTGGVTDFTGLTDTPASFNGQKNKFLAVKDDESGVEFVTTPSIDVRPIEDRLDLLDQSIAGHVADFELMRDGHIPTSWNGLGAKTITSPNNITAANLTDSPFCIGTGTVAGKKFILPDIAELGVMSLGTDQVREGRATYIVNLGNVDRIVEMTAGCKINITGGATSQSQTIPRKTGWMLSPGVFAGDKVWTFLGALSAETLDIAGFIDRIEDLEARPLIEKFTDLADTPDNYRPGQVLRYNQAGDGVTSTEFGFKHMSDTPSDYSGQKNKMLVVNNGETALEFKTVPDTSGLQNDIDDNYNSIITLQNGQTIQDNNITAIQSELSTLTIDVTGIQSTITDHGASISDLETTIGGVQSGQHPLSWNSLAARPMSTAGSVSAEQIAGAAFVNGTGSTTGRSYTLPDIVSFDATTLTSSQVREGRVTYIVNLASVSRTVVLSGGCKFNMTGSNITTTQTIPAKTTWMLSPGIYGNGDKVWTFLGKFSCTP